MGDAEDKLKEFFSKEDNQKATMWFVAGAVIMFLILPVLPFILIGVGIFLIVRYKQEQDAKKKSTTEVEKGNV